MTFGDKERQQGAQESIQENGIRGREDSNVSFKSRLLAKRMEILKISDPCAVMRDNSELLVVIKLLSNSKVS